MELRSRLQSGPAKHQSFLVLIRFRCLCLCVPELDQEFTKAARPFQGIQIHDSWWFILKDPPPCIPIFDFWNQRFYSSWFSSRSMTTPSGTPGKCGRRVIRPRKIWIWWTLHVLSSTTYTWYHHLIMYIQELIMQCYIWTFVCTCISPFQEILSGHLKR